MQTGVSTIFLALVLLALSFLALVFLLAFLFYTIIAIIANDVLHHLALCLFLVLELFGNDFWGWVIWDIRRGWIALFRM